LVRLATCRRAASSALKVPSSIPKYQSAAGCFTGSQKVVDAEPVQIVGLFFGTSLWLRCDKNFVAIQAMQNSRQIMISIALRKVLKQLHYPLEITLVWVRWYVAYPRSCVTLKR
jgi:hypothetical protein